MKKIIRNLIYISIVYLPFLLASCSPNQSENTSQESETVKSSVANANPAAQGFNESSSDAKAIEVADSVMSAMGGRKAWDNTRYIAWNFLGFRKLIWDKWTGDVRVENVNNDFKVLVNINTLDGKVYKNGEQLSQPDSVQKYLQRGKEIWINDSYWLVMPFKLKDSGVTLKYLGEEPVMDKPSHVLELTFDGVGVTPENKYKVFVDKETNLVNQWAFYRNHEDEEPGFTLPWQNYKEHGEIFLSGDRGPRQLTEVKVFEELPKSVFESLDAVNLDQYKTL